MNSENNIIEQASRQKSLKGGLTSSFIIQKNKLRADGTAPIFARIIVNGKMTLMSTNQTILPERWSIERQRTLGHTRSEKEINEYLDTFKVAIQNRYIDTMLRDADISSHMIKSSLLNALKTAPSKSSSNSATSSSNNTRLWYQPRVMARRPSSATRSCAIASRSSSRTNTKYATFL